MASAAGKIEFGDFQTPMDLARRVCALAGESGIAFRSVVEPTCGIGNFLIAAKERIPTLTDALGVEVNPSYAAQATHAMSTPASGVIPKIVCANFFDYDWSAELQNLPEPLLVIGNPPWVTNAELSSIGSRNLPVKSNIFRHRGIDALTGKSNFDISEWMLIQAVEWMSGRSGMLAVLCKTSVARKVMTYAWKRGLRIKTADLYLIDAQANFSASVDACLLAVVIGEGADSATCAVHPSLDADATRRFGFDHGRVIANADLYRKWRPLAGNGNSPWRSGVKHDCAAVFELQREGELFRNGNGELAPLDATDVFPLLKSSDVANGRQAIGRRWILMTQRHAGDDTTRLETGSPLTWSYLQANLAAIQRRASNMYKSQHPFAMYGVGPYSYAPWKVAISGLYKRLFFQLIPPFDGKPVILDDTCYFLPFETEIAAKTVYDLLNSTPAQEFLESLVFWDSKRPITADLLRSLDLERLAKTLGKGDLFVVPASKRAGAERQLDLGTD
ncbi:SAM-dependent DNA methyltransferase [candidate division KSB1 bacterium]|nr:SAM-dependent DNA methyltransferase [candidate division KSB1 bacterium]